MSNWIPAPRGYKHWDLAGDRATVVAICPEEGLACTDDGSIVPMKDCGVEDGSLQWVAAPEGWRAVLIAVAAEPEHDIVKVLPVMAFGIPADPRYADLWTDYAVAVPGTAETCLITGRSWREDHSFRRVAVDMDMLVPPGAHMNHSDVAEVLRHYREAAVEKAKKRKKADA